jgi:RecA/RadA recombinase
MSEREIRELTDIPGIGPTTASKLQERGIGTPEDFMFTPMMELKEILGWSTLKTKDTLDLVKRSILPLAMKPMTHDEYAEYRKKRVIRISSGSRAVDDILGGGFETDSIYGLTGEYACHSEDTQVLTLDGVKDWKSLSIGDLVLGVDSEGNIVRSRIERIMSYPFSGRLLHFKSHRFDLMVTPNHRVYQVFDSKIIQITAEEATKKFQGHFPIFFGWRGENSDTFDIQPYVKIWSTKCPEKSHPMAPLPPLNTDSFLRLLGWYLTSGGPFKTERGNYVQLSAKNDLNELIDIIKELGLSYSVYGGRKVIIFHRDLAEYLKRCGPSREEQKIPEEIFNLSKEHLRVLFETMTRASSKRGFQFYTSSRKLREQLALLGLICGYSCSIKDRYVNISRMPRGYWDKRNNLEVLDYEGTVWCFQTSTGNFFTVRNGIPTISGNSGKSQLCYSLAMNTTQLKLPDGKMAEVAWIETEPGTYRPERLDEIAKSRGLSFSPKQINVMPAANIIDSNRQRMAYEWVEQLLEKGRPIKLLVVDSFTAKIRQAYSGREMLPARSQDFSSHFQILERIAAKYNICIVLTLQVMGIPDTMQQGLIRMKEGKSEETYGGSVMKHSITFWVSLEQIKSVGGMLCRATLFDAPHLPRRSAEFLITEKGVIDAPMKGGKG